jgi:branched-chain amino acid transport system substrate-binding protein
MRSIRGRVLAAVLVLGLIGAACSNSGDDGGSSSGSDSGGDGGGTTVDQPGVTDTEIKVGGVVTLTGNPIGSNLNGLNDGVEAYFDMVNADGGIYGRDLVLADKRDDALVNNSQEVQQLVQSDIFAAIPMGTFVFSGADILGESGIPTFGWNVNPEWAGHDNLFNQEGALCFDCAGPGVPWIAQETGSENVGILAYNVPQSAGCADGTRKSLEQYGDAEAAYIDTSLPYGNVDFSAQVSDMIDADVDLVTPCMDQNGVLNLAREMRRQGLDATFYLPNAYDHGFMDEYGEFFEGAYVRTRFAPLETDPQPENLALYTEWMDEAGFDQNEYSLIGWILADMFVTGLELAGEDFTQQKVIDALNEETAFTAGGLLPGLDWTIQHDDPAENPESRPETDCSALTQIEGGEFVPVFTEDDKPFVCFTHTDPELPEDPENR